VSLADVAWLVAELPREVSFASALVEAPRQKDYRSTGPNLIVSHLKLVSGVTASVLVTGVVLGRGGGPSLFSLTTYKSSDLAEKVDERLHFAGFYQPGKASLSGQLRSLYTTLPAVYPVRSGLPSRGGEASEITFEVSFTFNVVLGDHFVLTCEGSGAYLLLVDERLRVSRMVPGDLAAREAFAVEGTSSGEHRVDVALLGLGSLGAGALVLQPGQVVECVIWVLPTLGINNWRVETFRSVQLTNTNDGNSAGFEPVAQLTVLIQAQRSPPLTTVDVKLQVSLAAGQGESMVVPELLLVAPPGFAFPELCGDFCTSRGEVFGTTGRAMATLTSLASATLLDTELLFQATTPVRSPSELTWVVQARGLADQVVGWGSTDSFKVNQMQDAAVLYGGIAGMRKAEVAVIFTLSMNPGDRMFTTVEVTGPSAVHLSCREAHLRRISLPGEAPACEKDGQGQLRLSLSESLQAGSYAFTVRGEIPEEDPNPNLFAVIVRERATEEIIDAAFDLPGWPLVELQMTQPTLAWSTGAFGGRSSVTVGFTLSNYTSLVQLVLISLPPGFQQIVRTANDLKSSNYRLPLLKGSDDWIDRSSPARLRVLLERSDPLVASGSYRFTFPVALPETAPSVSSLNLWHLSLCTDWYCREPGDVSVLVSFPMAGFVPGEESSLELARANAALDAAGQLVVNRAAVGHLGGSVLFALAFALGVPSLAMPGGAAERS